MNQQLSKNIAFAYFSGYATPLQKKLIEEWLGEEQNREQFYQWLEEWEREHPQFLPDKEKALQRFLGRINGDQTNHPFTRSRAAGTSPVGRQPLSRAGFFRWWMAAAVLFLGIATFLLTSEQLYYRTYTTAYGQVKKIQLEDGSEVTLNAHSSLRVPRFGFGKSSREVFLTGEAEFIVTHTIDNQRFLVKTPDQLAVEVLGTEFIVKARESGTKIALSKGKVQLKSLRQAKVNPVTMQPGDVVEVDGQGKFNLQAKQEVEVHAAWKENRFVFNNTPLREVGAQIHEIFGVQVAIPDTALAQRRITGNYRAESADELLQVLSELLDIRLSRKDGKVMLMNARRIM